MSIFTLDHFLWFGCGFAACTIINFLLARQYDREHAQGKAREE